MTIDYVKRKAEEFIKTNEQLGLQLGRDLSYINHESNGVKAFIEYLEKSQ